MTAAHALEAPGPTGIRSAAGTAGPQRRTLAIAALGTLLVLATFSAPVATVTDSARALHGGLAGETWTLSGMSLGLASALLTVGALADSLGRRRVLAWSTLLLAATSVLAATSPSIEALIAARILQGIAGAGVVAASLALIGHAFPDGAARTNATAAWGAALGAGIALGPVAAAALVGPLGWQSSYWLEALAAAALLPGVRALPESRADAPRRVDAPGALLLCAAMSFLTAGLVEGRSSWSSALTLALLAGGLLLLAAFAAVERARRKPMLELHRFTEPVFIASITGALFTGLALIGLMSFSPTMLQRGLGVSPLGSAAVLATWSATSMLVALGVRRLPQSLAATIRLAIGLALAAVGELALTTLHPGSSWSAVVPGLFIAGVGSGIANAALGRLAVDSVEPARAGTGSGANNTARYLGGAAGVALVVAVSSGRGGGHAAAALVNGWDTAALVSAALCLVGAAVALACRTK